MVPYILLATAASLAVLSLIAPQAAGTSQGFTNATSESLAGQARLTARQAAHGRHGRWCIGLRWYASAEIGEPGG